MLRPFSQTLSTADALHLLRRTTFATSWPTLKNFAGKTADDAVDFLLDNALKNPKPQSPSWINSGFPSWWKLPQADQQKAIDGVYKRVYEENYELKRWWAAEMGKDLTSIREKMTLFWHGHFTTKFAIDDPMHAGLMYRQNVLFRELHQGNFRELVEKIAIDGAMLFFLNGKDSTKTAPNENFSRELLELYTVGIGNYSEQDVKEGARVFTGWKVNVFSEEWKQFPIFQAFIAPNEHDFEAKSYLGETIHVPFTASYEAGVKQEIKDLVNIILSKKSVEVSEFICEKLFRYFVYSKPEAPDGELIKSLAKTFRDNNWEIRPVLSQLLKSEFFFSEAARGVQIKTPAETVVGFSKHFDVKEDWKEWVMVTMGQELLNPPNVAGWAGYRKWTDTRTFPFAVQQLSYFVWNQTNAQMITWIAQFDQKENADKLVEQILTLFLAKSPTTSQLEKYKKELLGGTPDYEWPNMIANIEQGGFRLKLMLLALLKTPDFHLC
ncbi:DUF1800 domain-containing protein [Lacihabitans sp. LS3-19]|uniref:DUF1800 domain-containing protein n=1 Tax=Lacihabitans sp. LS3-19 TaxID=2487335 RepID=UPI0020CCA57C|nr:DUF1800 domain-containing protein [Lacihabitans sp. LS3-19]MCP9769484.1 DUF1800 domain-containing protein [Lacihabitans sp. LS3-19]